MATGKKLSDKHRAFVREYLKDQNATQAYIRAGYSSKGAGVAAHKLLKNANISDAIATGQAKLLDLANITAEKNLRAIAKIAYSEELFVKDADRLKACELIGKTFGQFKEVTQVQHSGAVGTFEAEQVASKVDEVDKKY